MRVCRDSVVTVAEQTSLVQNADNLTMRGIYNINITMCYIETFHNTMSSR